MPVFALGCAVPVRATVTARGKLGPGLLVAARLSFWAGRGVIRVDLTVHNPAAARHDGGTWDLGDAGSLWLFAALMLLASVAFGAIARRFPEVPRAVE